MTTQLSVHHTQEQNEKLIDFYYAPSDYGHIVVRRCKSDGVKETIGHIYTEVEGEELKYICTNRDGREVFPAIEDFNGAEVRFERYARLLAAQEKTQENNRQLQTNYSHNKNNNPMKTTSKNFENPRTKINQLIFTEYEKPTKDGHFITIRDSYHNAIGKIHKSFNEEIRKFEYTSFDHAGNPMSKSEKLWELKNEYVSNRDQLLEQAHQRRIEGNAKAKEAAGEKEQPVKPETTKEKVSEKEHERTDDEQSRVNDREQQLEDLRDDKEDDRGEIDLDR